MNELRKLFYLLLIIPILFVQTGCSEDGPVDPPAAINEAEVLVKYLEENGDAVSTFPKMIVASDVFGLIGSEDMIVIDIRSAEAYNAGHIQDAVNVPETNVLEYYETNSLESKTKVVIACVTGQTAGWVNGLLRLAGKTNTFDLKWGMCSWNDVTASAWKGIITDPNALDFVTTATTKPTEGSLPTLSTEETDGANILRARIDAIFAEGFSAAAITNATVYINPANYFIVNYWIEDHYNLGHINGVINPAVID